MGRALGMRTSVRVALDHELHQIEIRLRDIRDI
jgi:hypothetical protein